MPFAHDAEHRSATHQPAAPELAQRTPAAREPDVPSSVPGAELIGRGYDFSRLPVHAEHEADEIAEEAARNGNQASDVVAQRFGVDLSGVRVHTGTGAARAARATGARAYTLGRDIVFGAGEFRPDTVEGNRLFAHELTHVAQQANGLAPAIQRKEVRTDKEIHGERDWTTADREHNTQRWRSACLANLNSGDSSQYVRIAERRDFYKWFFDYASSQGFETRWALAASVVAEGARQIAEMDTQHETSNDMFSVASVELQGAMREGNQVIFDNVLPKLKALLDGGKLTGDAALNWDMQTLSEEQQLIQPLYRKMSPESVRQMDAIARKTPFVKAGIWADARMNHGKAGDEVTAGQFNYGGTVPAFEEKNLTDVHDRWTYGMKLGNVFRKTGTLFDPAKDPRPEAGAEYRDGSKFAAVDTRAHLHVLDAWLNPDRMSRIGPGSDVGAIINGLTPVEKRLVLADRSPDGWSYSVRFAQFGFISEATVRRALPDGPEFAGVVAAFLVRYRNERARVEMRYPTGVTPPM